MIHRIVRYAAGAALLAHAATAQAQALATEDPVIRRLWTEGMERSQAPALAQTLTDSIGPRLTGSPGMEAGQRWLVRTYAGWGIAARNEKYGTWRGWRRGTTHVDLVAPRVRSLDATMLAWSPGTKGAVEGGVVLVPDVADRAAFERWLPQAKGKFVMTSFPEPTCRPDSNFKQWALAESFDRMREQRTAARTKWAARLDSTVTGASARDLPKMLEAAGARGVITSLWSQGWGVEKIFQSRTQRVPTLGLSCEDYGLVARLAERGQGPVLRVQAESQDLGEVPVFNTIAEIRGSEKPDEYIVLSAHFDSWDGSSGATDNATGTVTMLEAMRLLKAVYPNPRRSIVVGHWSGEEQGLNGSRSFAADHPEIVKGMHVLFNQDNGTGRIASVSMQGFTGAGARFASYFSRLPAELTRDIALGIPGSPGGGGSDYASFVCHGAPAFSLGSLSWDYGTYTWHTNRDTYDKISLDDLKMNATLTAMLVYLAAEDPQPMPRDRRELFPAGGSGGGRGPAPRAWPQCTEPARSSGASTR